MTVAGLQLAMPEVLGLALEAEQRMVGAPATLLGIVPLPGLLLLPVDHQHGGVDIEEQPGGGAGVAGQSIQEPVVQAAELREHARGHAQEEAAQCSGLRVPREPREVLEDPVLPEQLSRLDSLEPEDDRVQQSEEHLAHTVSVVPLSHPHMARNSIFETQGREETVEKVHTAVVGERARVELDRKFSGATRQLSEA